MTAKNRHKGSSSSGEKSAASSPDDASKKSPKPASSSTSSSSTTSNGPSGPGSQGQRSGSCLGLLASALFYLALIGAAGFAAFYLQQVLEEIRETSSRHEQSARLSAQLGVQMDSVVQQVESLSSVVDGLESSLGITRVELEAAVSRMKRGEVETRRVEDGLHKLQNELLRELSKGLQEVKEAREKDFSSLELTVEQRLAEVSQSVSSSVAEFTGAQGQAQSQLAQIQARLGAMEDPALVKEELGTIAEAVAQITEAKKGADDSVDSLRQQIGSVREELQTRNSEVASLSQDMENMRAAVQENVGSLRQSLSDAEADLQTLKDKSLTVEGAVEQATEALRAVEAQGSTASQQAKKTSDELEARVQAVEGSRDSLSAAVSDITHRMESLNSKYGSLAVEIASSGLGQEVNTLRSSVAKLQSEMATLGGTQTEQTESLKSRLSALEKPEQLQSLQEMVSSLEAKAARLEAHDKAIAALQEALQQSAQSLSKGKNSKKGK